MDLVFPPSPFLAANIMICDACFSDLWVIPGSGADYKNTVVKYIAQSEQPILPEKQADGSGKGTYL